jgi:hypothetical protein
VAEKQKLRDLGQEEKLRDLGAPRVQPAGPAHPQFWAPFVVIGL